MAWHGVAQHAMAWHGTGSTLYLHTLTFHPTPSRDQPRNQPLGGIGPAPRVASRRWRGRRGRVVDEGAVFGTRIYRGTASVTRLLLLLLLLMMLLLLMLLLLLLRLLLLLLLLLPLLLPLLLLLLLLALLLLLLLLLTFHPKGRVQVVAA